MSKKNYGEAECAECGKMFIKNSPKQRYCSNSCKGAVANEFVGKLKERDKFLTLNESF